MMQESLPLLQASKHDVSPAPSSACCVCQGHSAHLLLCVTEAILCCLLWTRLAQHCIWPCMSSVQESQQPGQHWKASSIM